MPDSCSSFGRTEGAGRDNHLAVGAVRSRARRLRSPGSDCPAVPDDHLGYRHIGADREVGPLAGGLEVGNSRAAPAAVLRGGLVEADAVLFGAVEVAVVGQPVLLARLHEGRRELVGTRRSRDSKRALGSVVRCREPAVRLRAHEVPLHLVGGPALATKILDPAVVVLGHAAGEDLGVDGPAAAQHAALGQRDAAAVAVRLRNARIVPLVRPVLESREACGDMDEGMAVGSAGLEQQDAD